LELLYIIKINKADTKEREKERKKEILQIKENISTRFNY